MTIENALDGAEKFRKKLLTDQNLKDILKDVKDAANVIEGLTRIIYWYDANQQRLIKSINRMTKKEKAMKKILAIYLADGVIQDDPS